jgi:hypothetical protein
MPNGDSGNVERQQDSETIKLEKDIRSRERWLIGINSASVIVSIVIACIYFGQLRQMKEATKATKIAASAAQSAAATAKDTLDSSAQRFRTEQRPIIWLISDLGSPEFIQQPGNRQMGQVLWS